MAKRKTIIKDLMDPDSGELIPTEIKERWAKQDTGWCKVFVALDARICEDLRSMNCELKILVAFLAKVPLIPPESKGWLVVNQECLAKYCRMDRTRVCKSLAKLKALGYLEHNQCKAVHRWRVVPEIAFKGDLHEYRSKYNSDEPIRAHSIEGISTDY